MESDISYWVDNMFYVQIKERIGVEELEAMIMNFGEWWYWRVWVFGCVTWIRIRVRYEASRVSTSKTIYWKDSKFRAESSTTSSEVCILGQDNTLPVILSSDFNVNQVKCLVEVLKRLKRAIGCTMAEIIEIPPRIFSHKIQLMPDHKQIIEN